MQAYKAYYQGGRFVPLEVLKIPEGSQAIITVLDFPVSKEMGDVCRHQLKALENFRKGIQNCDEPVPEFERIHLREIEL